MMKKTITGEGGKGKRGRTTTLSGVIRNSGNIFEESRRDNTTHTHTLPTHSLTHPYIYTFLSVSHTNTLEVLLNLQHLIPGPGLPTVKSC